MKTTIPEFLIEMSKQMNSDPKRCTSHPFWQVRNKKYLITEEGYDNHHWEVVDTDDGVVLFRSDKHDGFEALADDLYESHFDWCKLWLEEKEIEIPCEEDFSGVFEEFFDPDYDFDVLPSNYKKFHLQETEEVLTTHLTKFDAEWFIQRKKHDYPNAYTYVESAYWSPQLKELQGWIKSLTQDSQL